MEYITTSIQTVDTLAAIESLVGARLAKYFWLYTDEDKTVIAINTLGQIVLTNEQIKLEWDGQVLQSEAAQDPFLQTSELLKKVPLQDWRAFGHISFDAVGYYLPYPYRSKSALMRFIIPETEITITKNKTVLRTINNSEEIQSALQNAVTHIHTTPNTAPLDRSDKDMYMQQVHEVISSIQAGELSKVIIARQVKLPGMLDLFSTYDSIRKNNPATRTFCFHRSDLSGVGSSPELLMRTTPEGVVETIPLAGTRKRGATPEEDAQLKQELCNDPKEVDEHKISVALAEEELQQVCVPSSVQVKDFMQIIPFRTVQHLSSRVIGQLAEGKNLWDALRVLFPGVTVSGIDKRSAVEKIAALEQKARGPYAGCVGWIDSTGASDLAISIRSAFEDSDGVTISAGAGIVAESVPELEYEESVHKMETMRTELVLHDN